MPDAVSLTKRGSAFLHSAQYQSGCPQFEGLHLKNKIWSKSDSSKQQANVVGGPEILTCKNGLQLSILEEKEHSPKKDHGTPEGTESHNGTLKTVRYHAAASRKIQRSNTEDHPRGIVWWNLHKWALNFSNYQG